MPGRKTVAVALQLMGVMLSSGVSLSAAFEAIQAQMEDEHFARLFADIEFKVTRQGWKMSQAMKQYPQAFPAYTLVLIASGEATVSLYDRIKRAGQLMEREHMLLSQVRSALTGPFITMTMATVVLLLIVRFVMPRFVDMYAGMGAELPDITRIVMAIVRLVNHPLFWLVLLAGGSFLYHRRGPISQRLFRRAIHLAPVNRWIGIILAAQFCDILGSMIREGVPVAKAIRMLSDTAHFDAHRDYLRQVHQQLVEEGDFASSIRVVPYFPPLLHAVAVVGQEVGSLDRMLASMHRVLQQEVDTAVTSLVTLVEPVMICLLGAFTAFFFIGLFLPVYGMITKIGG